LRRSILLPLQKRPITIDEQEAMISRIEKRVRQMGEREVSSKVLGEIIMSELKTLDDVAYVRFASVYRDFQDIDAFHQEIANIRPNEK
jgi:transcriptional repressor NrdR